MDSTQQHALVESAIDQLEDGGEVDAIVANLTSEGCPTESVRALVSACAQGIELAEGDEELGPEELVVALAERGVSSEHAQLFCDALYVDDDDDDDDDGTGWGMDLVEVDGIHVLQLSGDVSELDPEGRDAIRAKILDPVFAEDCRLVIDLRKAVFFQTDVVGLLISDVLAMRDAGGDLSLLVGENLKELAAKYRLSDLVHVESEAAAMDRLKALAQAPLGAERIRIEQSVVGEVGVLVPRGPLDSRTVEQFEQRVLAQFSETPNLVLDCTDVTWISSGGFALLVRLTSPSSPTKLKVAGLRGPAGLVAEAMQLGPILDLHPTREAALAAFA